MREIFGGAGFLDVRLDGIAEALWFGADAADAHGFVVSQLNWMVEGLDDPGRGRAVAALMATMRAHETTEGHVRVRRLGDHR